MTDHPVTPPPELVQQWLSEFYGSPTVPVESNLHIANLAAQWGADTELEACCKLLELSYEWDVSACEYLRAERRPKPSSLKEQSLKHLDVMERDGYYLPEILQALRRALEALPDD